MTHIYIGSSCSSLSFHFFSFFLLVATPTTVLLAVHLMYIIQVQALLLVAVPLTMLLKFRSHLRKTKLTIIYRSREILSLLQKMDSTLNSLVEITKKLAAAEGGSKNEDDPKYTVSMLLSSSMYILLLLVTCNNSCTHTHIQVYIYRHEI